MACSDQNNMPPDGLGAAGEELMVRQMDEVVVALEPATRQVALVMRDEGMNIGMPTLMVDEKGCVELILELQKALRLCRLLPVPPVDLPQD